MIGGKGGDTDPEGAVGSRRRWQIELPQQIEKVGLAYNLLREVSLEIEELIRLARGTPEERIYLGFQQDVNTAMSALVEARRRVMSYCG